MGEIHELFVLALSLVWFAGATPDVLQGILGAIYQSNLKKTWGLENNLKTKDSWCG